MLLGYLFDSPAESPVFSPPRLKEGVPGCFAPYRYFGSQPFHAFEKAHRLILEKN